MATFVAARLSGGSNQGNQSFQLDAGNGSNRAAVIHVAAYDAGQNVTFAVSAGGVAAGAPVVTQGNTSVDGLLSTYVITGIPSGTITVQVNPSQTCDELFVMASTWSNVPQDTPVTDSESASGTGASATIPTMTVGEGEVGIGALYYYVFANTTAVPSDTGMDTFPGTPAISGVSHQYGDGNLSWTGLSSSDWLVNGIVLGHDEDEPADETAPTYSENPSADEVGQTSVTVVATAADETDATVDHYAVAIANGASAPSAQQIAAGLDASGDPAIAAGSDLGVENNTEGEIVLEGLSPGTEYDIYYTVGDSSDNFATPQRIDVTTLPEISAPQIRGVETVGFAQRTNTTVDAVEGTQAGDNLILIAVASRSSSLSPTHMTPPEGFTALPGFPTNTVDDGTVLARMWAWRRIAGSSEPSDYTIAHSESFSDAMLVAISGGEQGAGLAIAPEIAQGEDDDPIVYPELTTLTANTLILAVAHNWDGWAGIGPPTGGNVTYTQTFNEQSNLLYLSAGVLAEPGPTGNATQDAGPSAIWSAALIAIQSSDVGPAPAPEITTVNGDNTISSGQTGVAITGANFANATVEIRQGAVAIEQTVTSQSSTSISIDVVFEIEGQPSLRFGTAELAVINADDQEDTIGITIDPPAGNLYVDVGTPNSEADNRITAVPDIESGDQLHARGVGGGAAPAGLHLNADGTFWFEDGAEPAAFDVRVWDVNDATWGAWATQSIIPGGETELAVGSASHGHTAASPTLVQSLVLSVASPAHGHAAESVDLTQVSTLAPADASHAQFADNVALTQANLLVVQDASHDHVSDSIVLTVARVLDVADSAHGHAADSVALTQAHVLGVADALHGHSADSVDLSLSVLISVADALHSHGVDNVALTQAHVLAVAGALHGHFAANVVLEHATFLDVDGAIHGHSASGVQLSLADILAVASSIQEHTADEIELAQQHVLIVSDAVHAQIAELVDVRLPGLAASRDVFMITAEDRIYLIAPQTQRVLN